MLACLNIFAYTSSIAANERQEVKISEFKRWLESQGVRVVDGTNHWRLYLNGKISTLPRHPAKELKEGTRRAILKQLDLK